MAHWINFHACATPNRVALVDNETGQQLTYAELDGRIRHLTAVLSEQFRVTPGQRVAMLSRNCAEAIELMYACAALGAIFVPLNVRLADQELNLLIDDCAPQVVIGERELLARSVADDLPRIAWEELAALRARSASTAIAVSLQPDSPWLIVYTSGTTGVPKGVIVTHAGSNATMLAGVVSGNVGADSISLTALPLWHVAGLNLFTNPTLFMGGTVVLMRAFDAEQAISLLTASRNPVTHFAGVPTHYQFIEAVLGHAILPNFVAVIGGASVPAALVERYARRGVALRPLYGITEAGSTVSMLAAGCSPNGPGDVGVVMGHLQCRIEPTGSDGDRQAGELLLAGDSVTPGYWNKPDDTARAVVDGWLHTGDIATITSDRRIRIIDRLKDMYISGGENVYPAEVEDALSKHPQVAQAAVVGVPDDKWGETGSAWLVLRSQPMPPDLDALRTWMRDQLGAFKIPRDIHIVESLPLNATGKVLKDVLRRMSAPHE
jgi:fatty-acyl-CoA synthase